MVQKARTPEPENWASPHIRGVARYLSLKTVILVIIVIGMLVTGALLVHKFTGFMPLLDRTKANAAASIKPLTKAPPSGISGHTQTSGSPAPVAASTTLTPTMTPVSPQKTPLTLHGSCQSFTRITTEINRLRSQLAVFNAQLSAAKLAVQQGLSELLPSIQTQQQQLRERINFLNRQRDALKPC